MLNHSKLLHDLRSPLNSILGFNQLLQLSGLRNPTDTAKSRCISSNGNKLVELFDEMQIQLQFISPEAIRSQLNRLDYTFNLLHAVTTSFSIEHLDQDQVESLNEIRSSVQELAVRLSNFHQTISPLYNIPDQ